MVTPMCNLLITSAMVMVMFSSLSVACLFVCLSVSNITEKRLNRCSRNFQGRCDLIQGTIGNIFRIFHKTPWTQEFFSPHFRRNPCFLAALQRQGLNEFPWNFQKRTGLTQGAILNIFGILWLTPWILGRFIYFPDLYLFVILWKKGRTDFH